MEFNKLIPELIVNNIEESLSFYIGVLGFKIEYGRTDPAFSFLSREGSQIMLEEFNATKNPWVTGSLDRPFGRGINFQIDVRNVEALYADVKQSRTSLYRELKDVTYKTGETQVHLKQFLVQDPDGYLLRFSQDIL
jgi:catechol 2,3-dioxygenase-like lactoylglutathione lyase family enzyme